MPSKTEIDEVKAWCKKKKDEMKSVPIIELNPFRNRFAWMMAKIKIAIDLPLDYADNNMAVYDSPTDALYVNVNGNWIKVEPDDIFEV